MKSILKNNLNYFKVSTILLLVFSIQYHLLSNDNKVKIPTEIRSYRIYANDNEQSPPVLLIPQSQSVQTNVGATQLTFEMDIYADVAPSYYAEFVHCDVNWNEDNNNFLNNSGFMRTSDFSYASSPYSSSYYSNRVTLQFPNAQVQFKYSGNYKIKVYEYYNDSLPVVEAKFFVVSPIASMEMYFTSSFYSPQFQISNSAYNIETRVFAPSNLFNSQLRTVVLYRNNRWEEPYVISEQNYRDYSSILYKYSFPTMVTGFSSSEKRFYINNIPSENVYRVLFMDNTAEFPTGNYPVRLPFSDYIRNGNYMYNDNDGYMVTSQISATDDNYVFLEFILDPAGIKSDEDVFISGSFNNWNPDIHWLMSWDKEAKLYRLKQWVRRATHNYLYGTGKLNIDTKKFDNISYDFYEGNTVYANHSILGFTYYHYSDFGGYDAIIGAIISSPLGTNWSR